MKKTLLILLIILIVVLGLYTVLHGYTIGPLKVLSFYGITKKDNELDQKINDLTKLSTVEYKKKKDTLEENSSKLQDAKQKYQDMVQVNVGDDVEITRQLQEYEEEYLWTRIGNHAKTEGVTLKIDITRAFTPEIEEDNNKDKKENTTGNTTNTANTTNTTNADNTSKDNEKQENTENNEEKDSSDMLYNLKFTASGAYVSIADFIYDIENDTSLGFKIEEFLISSTEDLDGKKIVATFTCKDIRINNITRTSEEQEKDKEEEKDKENTANNTSNSNTNSSKRNTTNSSNTSSNTNKSS